ncbi:hypothetical protein FVEG_16395 [Fusarium verticillioides 7600]|uniref:Uncharacterized protein n=1 Tax=Gibberella moniliformis (strain M3125 / FGSC 7600) TaxID=334819 RepID=W7MMP2_GIBM7|nr:hypothetical protein FVEG_16395 [Fusarium verticillioides 7600]EWG49049.1 hypothetical protein FVEG_16395 [Fusarium verticillioides 7600]RBQ66412.1 hypothetical protein FVER14953_21340 [Fusarium verticillioides]RBR21247.1 hypothetical protein FVER53590_30456 [Fusarium verticillioides]
MPSDNHNEKPTAASNPYNEDEWQIVDKEDTQPVGVVNEEKKEVIQEKIYEKSAAEEKRELAKARWEGMQPQRGGVYPNREVKVPSYPQFTGNW